MSVIADKKPQVAASDTADNDGDGAEEDKSDSDDDEPVKKKPAKVGMTWHFFCLISARLANGVASPDWCKGHNSKVSDFGYFPYLHLSKTKIDNNEIVMLSLDKNLCDWLFGVALASFRIRL